MEGKMRVFELAKEIGYPSSELVDFLVEEGVQIKNHMSYIGPYEIRIIKEHYGVVSESDEPDHPVARVRKRAKVAKKEEAKKAQEEKAAKKAAEAAEKAADVPSAAVESAPAKDVPAETGAPLVKEAASAHIADKETAPVKEAQAAEDVAPPVEKKKPVIEDDDESGKGKKVKKGEVKQFPKKKKAKKGAKKEAQKTWEEHLDWTDEEREAAAEQAKRDAEPARKISWSEIMKNEEKANAKLKGKKKSKKDDKPETAKLYLMKGITYRDFAESMELRPKELLAILAKEGIEVEDLDSAIEEDYAYLIAEEYNKELGLIKHFGDDVLLKEYAQSPKAQPVSRPPVVTIMGHVDHGKTSILDYIRHSRITEGEFGGITQHIGAYSVKTEKGEITFIDTPGHAAFTAMRARGANITDIVVLVVAADDGVMPQTIEAVNHAKAAGVPVIIAVNKMDLPGANPDRVKQDLTQYGIVPEEWGGENLFVNCSAKTGDGIPELLDMIILQGEMMELTSYADVPARGIVVESNVQKGIGNVATILIKEGTLSVGDVFVVGNTFGKVRGLTDDMGKKIKTLKTGRAGEVTGLEDLPGAGDDFAVINNEKAARNIADRRAYYRKRSDQIRDKESISLEDLFARMNGEEKAELIIIIKGDTQGTVEAIIQSIEGMDVSEIDIKILHTGVGMVAETDVNLAITAGAVITAFNVRVDTAARRLAEENGVEIRTYNIIYNLLEDLHKALEGMLEPESVEVYLGTAEVRQVFKVPKIGAIGGCYVKDGKIVRNCVAKLVRDGQYIWEGKLSSLQRFKDSVKEVAEGYECGIGLEGFNDIKDGDLIEAHVIEERKRTLD